MQGQERAIKGLRLKYQAAILSSAAKMIKTISVSLLTGIEKRNLSSILSQWQGYTHVIKRHQNVLSKKVADHFQCFCIELNRSDIVFLQIESINGTVVK